MESKLIKSTTLEPVSHFREPSDKNAERKSLSQWGINAEYWIRDLIYDGVPSEIMDKTRKSILELLRKFPEYSKEKTTR